MLTTPGILLLAIRAGLLTMARADEMKAALEGKRFRMTFSSSETCSDLTPGRWNARCCEHGI